MNYLPGIYEPEPPTETTGASEGGDTFTMVFFVIVVVVILVGLFSRKG